MKEIRKIISHYMRSTQASEKWALASVVRVEESSYRRIGARMLVKDNGEWIGGISGGCLEGDALKRSQMAIFKNKPSMVVYDTMDDDKNQIGVGLGCNGRIEVLFTPIHKDDKSNEIEELKRIDEKNAPAVLLKVIYSETGDHLGKVVFVEDENANLNFCGLDENIIQELVAEVYRSKRNKVLELQNNENKSLKLLIEFIKPETRLIIVGDNYDVHAFVGLSKELGWDVSIIGRAKKLPKEIFQLVDKVYEYEEAEQVLLDEYTAVVLMTHDYNWDKKMLPIFLNQKLGYLGMLGPRKRMDKMKLELGLLNLDEKPNFYSPVGLDIGAESPEEISLAIAAEIVGTFRNSKALSLKYKEGSIHERMTQ